MSVTEWCVCVCRDLQAFGSIGKDLMNEETIELLFPYLDLENFQPGECVICV